jgi:hypothetical protein
MPLSSEEEASPIAAACSNTAVVVGTVVGLVAYTALMTFLAPLVAGMTL